MTTLASLFACIVPLAGGSDPCDVACPPPAILEGEACGTEINRGCFGSNADGSNCCEPHGNPGCDNPRCEALVCAIDSFCCPVAWDFFCVEEALKKCPELCAGLFTQAWSPLAIGDTICGSSHAPDEGTHDVDWYEMHLDAVTEVIVALSGGMPLELGIVDADGEPDCALATEWEPSIVAPACGTGTIVACLEAGSHWIVVRPAVDGGYPCGAEGTDYLLSVTAGATRCTLPDPINDTCEHALPLELGTTAISTHDAATESGGWEVPCVARNILRRDIWFKHVAARSGTLRLATCGTSDFDATLVVYHGTCDASRLIGCAWDGLGCSWNDPGLDIDVVAGEPYLVRLGGNGDDDGTLALTLSYLPCDPAYVLEVIGPSGHVESYAEAISEAGEIVGWQVNGSKKGFRWSELNGYELVMPGVSAASQLDDVAESGVAVGQYGSGSFGPVPAMAEGLALTALPTPPGQPFGRARAINGSGVIAGEATSCTSCSWTPVTWTGGVPAILPLPATTDTVADINDRGNLCGAGPPGVQQQGWVYIDGQFQWLPAPIPGAPVILRAMDNLDRVVGEVVIDNGPFADDTRGFVWTDGVYSVLQPTGHYDSTSFADITDDGAIIGHMDVHGGAPSPFIMKGVIAVELNPRLGRTDEFLRHAEAISGSGVIVGGIGTSFTRAARLVPVPPTGDLDCDGFTDAADLGLVLAAWGPCLPNTACGEDLNVDGVVDGADVGLVLSNWGAVR